MAVKVVVQEGTRIRLGATARGAPLGLSRRRDGLGSREGIHFRFASARAMVRGMAWRHPHDPLGAEGVRAKETNLAVIVQVESLRDSRQICGARAPARGVSYCHPKVHLGTERV